MDEFSVFAGLAPLEGNDLMLQTCPFGLFKDMAVVLIAGTEEKGYGVVTNRAVFEMKKMLGEDCEISDETIVDYVYETSRLFPAVIRPVTELMGGKFFFDKRELAVYNGKPGGAIALFYPGVLNEITEMLGDNVWLIPLSTMLFIAVPDTGSNDEIVEIAKNFLDDEQFLSDQVLHYQSSEEHLDTALEWWRRKMQGETR